MQSAHNPPMSRGVVPTPPRTQYGPDTGAQIMHPVSLRSRGLPQYGNVTPSQQGVGGIPQGSVGIPSQGTGLAHPISRGFVGSPQHPGINHSSIQQMIHGPGSMLNPATIPMPPISNFQHRTQPNQYANPATMLMSPMQSFQQPIQSIQQPIQSIRVPTQQIQQSQQYQQPQYSTGRVASSPLQSFPGATSIGVPGQLIHGRSNTSFDAVDKRGGRVDHVVHRNNDKRHHGEYGRALHKRKDYEGRAPSWLRLFAS